MPSHGHRYSPESSPPQSDPGSSSARESDNAWLTVVPRSRQVLGGALGTSLITSPRPESASDAVLDEHSKSGVDAKALQKLLAQQKEQLETYKRTTEHFILERHYALERSIERMLQDAFDSASHAKDVPASINESKLQHSAASPPPADFLLQLERMLRESEARAAHECSLLTQQIVHDAMRSIERVLEEELNKQNNLISNLRGVKDDRDPPSRFRGRRSTMKTTVLSDSSKVSIDVSDAETKGETEKSVTFAAQDSQREIEAIGKEIEALDEEQGQASRGLNSAKNLAATIKEASHELGKAVGFNKGVKTRDIFLHHPTEAKNNCHELIQKVAHSGVFFAFMETCILINVLIKAVQMDIDVRRAVNGEKSVKWGYFVDVTFTSIFILELLIRITADHWWFFFGNQRVWNLFDLAVVASSCFEILTDGLNIGFLRIFRSLRLVRILKIVRVFRFFRELRLMAVSIASCMASLFWALVMMFVVVLVFAMFVLEGSKNYMRDTKPSDDLPMRRDMVTLFGSFPKALYTLIQAVTGGNDWAQLAAPLLEVSWVYGAGFALFISFVTLGMMNILVGIFVENAQQYSQLDRDLVIQEEMHQRKSYMNQLRDLFHEMDQDHSGTVTYEEFNDCLSHERARAYLDFLQLSASEAQGLFMLLDLDENGEVGVEEFVLGCMRLKGTAKSIDAASMMFQTKRLAVKLNEFFEFTRVKLEIIANALDASDDTQSEMGRQESPDESEI